MHEYHKAKAGTMKAIPKSVALLETTFSEFDLNCKEILNSWYISPE